MHMDVHRALRRGVLLVVLLLISAVQLQAAIYKWVDKNGVVTYKNTPPPVGVTSEKFVPNPNFIIPSEPESEQPSMTEPSLPATTLQGNKPASTLQGNKPASTLQGSPTITPARTVPQSFPAVDIYTTSWCPACKEAKSYLRSLKVPFKEYDVEKSLSAAQKLSSIDSSGGVPVTVIGGSKILGFNQSAFDRALGIR